MAKEQRSGLDFIRECEKITNEKAMGFFKKQFGIQDKPKADFLNSSVRTGETKTHNVK